MLMFLLSLVLVAAVSSMGALVVRAISLIPLSVLDCAADGGRYSRLESRAVSMPPRPAAGRRAAAPPMFPGRAWLPAAVHSAAAAAAAAVPR